MEYSKLLLLSLLTLSFSLESLACDPDSHWRVRVKGFQSGDQEMFFAPNNAIQLNEKGTGCKVAPVTNVLESGDIKANKGSLDIFEIVESVGIQCTFASGDYISTVATYFRAKNEKLGLNNRAAFTLSDKGAKEAFDIELACGNEPVVKVEEQQPPKIQ